MISQAILSFPSNPVILRFNLRFVPTCSHHSHQTIFPILYPATTTTTSTSTTTFEIFGEPVAVREHPPDCWESQQLGVISYSHYSLKLSPLYLLHSSQRILIYMFCQIMTLSRDITPSRGAWLEYHRISMGWTVNSKFSVGEYLNYGQHRLWGALSWPPLAPAIPSLRITVIPENHTTSWRPRRCRNCCWIWVEAIEMECSVKNAIESVKVK